MIKNIMKLSFLIHNFYLFLFLFFLIYQSNIKSFWPWQTDIRTLIYDVYEFNYNFQSLIVDLRSTEKIKYWGAASGLYMYLTQNKVFFFIRLANIPCLK